MPITGVSDMKTMILTLTAAVAIGISFSAVFVSYGNEVATGEDEPGKAEKTQDRGEEELLKGRAAYSIPDYDSAAKHFALAAEQGSAEAQYRLGLCYRSGTGVEIDNSMSFKCFLKGAEQGDMLAQFYVGDSYHSGIGVPKDVSKGEEWSRKAFPGLKQAAENGDPEAQVCLATLYYYARAVNENKHEAATLYLAAAEQGDSLGQLSIATCYFDGDGVEKDWSEAEKWFRAFVAGIRKAAEHGDAEAQFRLGYCYDEGKGVEKDPKEAAKWFRKAAEKGLVYAQVNFGAC